MHKKSLLQRICLLVIVALTATSLQAVEIIPEKKQDVNCFGKNDANYLMEENKAEFFAGLSIAERYQKLYDGSFERYFSQKFDSIEKKPEEPNFFTGLSITERFQKLYDGSLERHFTKKHEAKKKETYIQGSMYGSNAQINCKNNLNTIDTNGLSVSDKMQILRDGSFEKKVFGK